MEMINKNIGTAVVKANRESKPKALFPVTKEDVKAILFCVAGVVTVVLIRVAVFLPQYMN